MSERQPKNALWPASWEQPATWRVWAQQAAIGAALGGLLVASVFLIEWAAGWLTVTGITASGAVGSGLVVGLGRSLLVALVEETVFRGLLLGYGRGLLGLPLAVVVSAAAFGLVHAWNANVTPLAVLNLAVAGLLFALAFLVGRGLALPIGLHAAWNWFEGWVFGFPLSGTLRDSLLAVDVRGPEGATGGAFGPEGGAVGLVAMGLTGALLWLLRDRLPQVRVPSTPE